MLDTKICDNGNGYCYIHVRPKHYAIHRLSYYAHISEPLGDILLYATDQQIKTEDIGFEFDLERGQPKTKMFQQVFSCEGTNLTFFQETPSYEYATIPMWRTTSIEISGFTSWNDKAVFDLNIRRWRFLLLVYSGGTILLHFPALSHVSRSLETHQKVFVEFTLQCQEMQPFPRKGKASQRTPFDIEIVPREALPPAEFDLEIEQ